jgi:hypothetical protein
MKDIYKMDLFETTYHIDDKNGSGFVIIRVPGGWVLELYKSMVFIPYNEEFIFNNLNE